MSNSQLPDKSSGSILEKGLDIMRDPNAGKAAKAGAVCLLAIGAMSVIGCAIGSVAKSTIEVIGQSTDAK